MIIKPSSNFMNEIILDSDDTDLEVDLFGLRQANLFFKIKKENDYIVRMQNFFDSMSINMFICNEIGKGAVIIDTSNCILKNKHGRFQSEQIMGYHCFNLRGCNGILLEFPAIDLQ